MSTREEPIAGDQPRDQDAPASRAKKTYRKPVLSKYEQLHGIGIGGSV